MQRRAVLMVGFAIEVLLGCGSGGGSPTGGAGSTTSATPCQPREARACTCASGGDGAQLCAADGSAWEPCLGCGGSTSSTSGTGGAGSGGGGGGLPALCTDGYPPGPYGLLQNDTIDNIVFQGVVDGSKDLTMKPIHLCELYNPTGAQVHPAGSPFGAGLPKPKALLVIVSAQWSGPSNLEAKVDLPPRHAMYAPLGGEFLTALEDGHTPFTPATPADLLSWIDKYDVNYPTGLDEPRVLSSATTAGYPNHLIVDTRTMTIVGTHIGVPSPALWATFEATLGP